MVLDQNSTILFWNQALAKLSNFNSEDVINQNFASIFDLKKTDTFLSTLKNVCRASLTTIWSEYQNARQLAQLSVILGSESQPVGLTKASFRSLNLSNGETVSLIEIHQSPQLKTGAAPQGKNHTTNAISFSIENFDRGVIIADENNYIVTCNHRSAEIFGYSDRQMENKPLRLILPDIDISTINAISSDNLQEGISAEGDPLKLITSFFPRYDGVNTALVFSSDSSNYESESALLYQREVLSSIYQNTADGIILLNQSGHIEHINPVGLQILGLTEPATNDEHIDSLMVLEDSAGRTGFSPPNEAMNRGTIVEAIGDVYVKTAGREPEPISITATPLRNKANKVMGCVVVFRSVIEARRVSNRLTWQSSHDALTQLPNRRHLEKEVLLAIDEVHINRGLTHTLLYIDLYNFSVINDTSGHNAGDELLRQFARILEDFFEPTDVIARIGNDEFAVLIRDKPVEQARELAETLLDETKGFSFPWDGKRLKIGLSIGAKVIDPDVTSEIDVLVAAGSSCAAAKEAGRNRVKFQYHTKEISQRKSVADWIPKISDALEEQRFELFSQPIIPLDKSAAEPGHYEVLTRMRDKAGNIILPGKFIPAAEHYGLIEDIDRWVLDSVFDYQSQRLAAGLPLCKYAINLSGKSIGDENLRSHIITKFSETGLDPKLFQFEITETAAIRNFDHAIELIQTLKAQGCYFSLDDFGSGLSSLVYLKELPVDYLKIDGSFIKNMEVSEIDYSMVSTINHLGHIMGIKTVAECVENVSQLTMLKEIGLDYVQGFYFSKPQPIDSFDHETSYF